MDFKNLKLFPIYNFFLFFLFKIFEEQFDLPFFLNTQDDKKKYNCRSCLRSFIAYYEEILLGLFSLFSSLELASRFHMLIYFPNNSFVLSSRQCGGPRRAGCIL